MPKNTATHRICNNRLTPIGWGSSLYFGGQYVSPPKKSCSPMYSTSSLGRIENFERYDTSYRIELKKLWTKLVIDIGTNEIKYKDLNEWQKMLIKKFGKLKYEKPI